MKTLQDFRNIEKQYLPREESTNGQEDNENVLQIIRYDWVEIAKYKDGTHSLILGNREFTGELEKLEEILWDWYKFEIGVNPADLRNDLDARAVDLMQEIDEAHGRTTMLSLDEYLHEVELTEAEKNKINYLLREFNDL